MFFFYQIPIRAIYQDFGDTRMNALFDTILKPRLSLQNESSELVYLFWFKVESLHNLTGGLKTIHQRPNHFVPVMQISSKKYTLHGTKKTKSPVKDFYLLQAE